MEESQIKKQVREGYAKIASQGSSCCGPDTQAKDLSSKIGYSDEEMGKVPEGSNLGLGCGNPTALASIKKGETVLDLGAGGGFDCFLAANKVGPTGKVIGIDMTPEMIERARSNARKGKYNNVEFRLGEIEKLPVEDDSVDIVISNCVINLSPDKTAVFSEVFRVLKPGGRLMISDVILMKELPEQIKNSVEAYIGCLSGAMLKGDYLKAVEKAGFAEITILEEVVFPIESMLNDPTAIALIENLKLDQDEIDKLKGAVVSMKFSGKKQMSK